MAKLNHATCTCCGSEITVPQFYQGKAYGYTCITKVAPQQKRTLKTGTWIKPDSLEVIVEDNKYKTVVKVGNWTVKLPAYNESGDNSIIKSGLLLISHPQKGATFKNMFNELNSKGKTCKWSIHINSKESQVLWEDS